MKIREFSDKYDIPKEIVYEASFRLDGNQFDFEPSEIAVEVRKIVSSRLKTHRARVERSERILRNLEGV